jgi:hypothetical protein
MEIKMGPTLSDCSPGVRDMPRPQPALSAAKARHGSVWPALAIMIGLLSALAWSGFLGWAVYRMIGGLWGW